jgi:hypothetical protein
MAKTKVVKKTIKKEKQEGVSLMDYPKSLYQFDFFTKNITSHTTLLYGVLLIVLLLVVNFLKSIVSIGITPIDRILSVSLIGIPLLIFTSFAGFYVILNAFENNRKPFWLSFVVFLAIAMQFIVIGHILDLLVMLINVSIFTTLISLLLIFLMVYFVVNFVINYKNYYNTSGYRVVVSFLLVNTVIGIFSMVYYFQILLSNMIGN